MTRIGAKQEAEIASAFICIAVSQSLHGRIWDALGVLVIFHISNILFGLFKKYLSPAFQFPFLAVCVLTLTKSFYIVSDYFEFSTQWMAFELLSISVILLHLSAKTFFTERRDVSKGFPSFMEAPGFILLLLVFLSVVIEVFAARGRETVLIVQLILGAFLIGVLNRLFVWASKVTK